MKSANLLEEKATRKLDEANAMADLNAQPEDPAKSLEEKYSSQGSAAVEDELSRLKEELGK